MGVAMLLTLLELSMLPREKLMLMLMPSTVLMDIPVLVILVLDTLAMVMLLLLFPMLLQLFLIATTAAYGYAAPTQGAAIAVRGYGTAATVGSTVPYGYAAIGRYVADSLGAVHYAKREAEAEP